MQPSARVTNTDGYGSRVINEDDENSGEFGFVTLDRKHTLKSFAAYADWAKAMHFSSPLPQAKPQVKEVSCCLGSVIFADKC
jgi:hypothetical protein